MYFLSFVLVYIAYYLFYLLAGNAAGPVDGRFPVGEADYGRFYATNAWATIQYVGYVPANGSVYMPGSGGADISEGVGTWCCQPYAHFAKKCPGKRVFREANSYSIAAGCYNIGYYVGPR